MTTNVELLVFVLGAPGAGKGTQCELIKKRFGWAHISAGDLLRAEVAAGSDKGAEIQEYMRQGAMVPSSWIIGLLQAAIVKGGYKKVLVDGFPRELSQLQDFEKQVMPCTKTLFYKVSEEVAYARLKDRSATSGRVDDNDDTIHKRFFVFVDDSMPVVDSLRSVGKVAEIDASGTPEEVFAATCQVVEQLEQQVQEQQVQHVEGLQQDQAALPAAAEAVAAVAAIPVEQAAVAAMSANGVSEGAANGEASADISQHQASAVSTGEVASDSSTAASSMPAAGGAAPSDEAEPALSTLEAAPASDPGITALAAEASSTGFADGNAAEVVAAAATASDATTPADATTTPLPAAVTSIGGMQMDLSGIRTPIVICGPSGVGKGTLISKLMQRYSNRFGFSVSHTTRGPRPGEEHGVHYFFTDQASMQPQVEGGMFLEHALVHGNMYGTSLAAVARVSAEGKHCVLDIDVQGAQQVRRSAVGDLSLFIFIAPPSHEELERRLRNRGTESEEKVLQRLSNAEAEIAKAQEPGLFHHTLVNEDLEVAFYELQQLIEERVPGLLPELRTMQAPQLAAAAAAAPLETPVSDDSGASQAATADQATSEQQQQAVPGQQQQLQPLPESYQQQQRQQQQQQHEDKEQHQHEDKEQHQQHAVPNGTVSSVAAGYVAGNGTSALLDFGFGASAGPAVAVKGMPVRQYMDATVIPVLREGLKALNATRPDDPLQYLADYLVAHKSLAH